MSELDQHSTYSTLRERIVEHLFVGEAFRWLWCRGVTDVEVLRSEFDPFGYDLVMVRGAIQRHVQLKTGLGGKPLRVSVGQALAAKPSGCVLWIAITPDLSLGPYWWFGGDPGEPLPNMSGLARPKRIGRRKAGDRPARSNHRVVPARLFRRITSIGKVLEKLIGPLPVGAPPAGREGES